MEPGKVFQVRPRKRRDGEAMQETGHNAPSHRPHVHPIWCSFDIPTDDGGVIHLSAIRGVATTDDAAGFIHVSVERRDGQRTGVPAIRIEGSAEQMTPVQAFRLASVLQAVAVAALLDGQASV
jgi:hypothetical protein